jgi:hypothetical protein
MNDFNWRNQPSTIRPILMRGLGATKHKGTPPLQGSERSRTSSIATAQPNKTKPAKGAFGSV